MEEGEPVALSDLLKVKVYDDEDRHIGHVQEMAVAAAPGQSVVGHLGVHLLWTDRVGGLLLVRRVEDLVVLVPWSAVARVEADRIILADSHPTLEVETAEGKWLLRRDILNKQMIDSSGNRIQRVDDVLLRLEGGAFRVDGLEVSRGMRMTSSSIRRFLAKLSRKYGAGEGSYVIPWAAVEKVEAEALLLGESVDD